VDICNILLTCLLTIPILGCVNTSDLTPTDTKLTRTAQYQHQISVTIARDSDNKKWSRLMLQELDSAIVNDDYDAYLFYLDEYEKIPREIVPPEFRNEPGYINPVSELEEHFRLRKHLRAGNIETKQIPPHAE